MQGSSWPAGVGSSRPDALEGLRLWRVSLHYGLNAHALPDLSTALQEAACRGGAEGREVLLMMEAATVAARPGGYAAFLPLLRHPFTPRTTAKYDAMQTSIHVDWVTMRTVKDDSFIDRDPRGGVRPYIGGWP